MPTQTSNPFVLEDLEDVGRMRVRRDSDNAVGVASSEHTWGDILVESYFAE